MTDQGFGVVRPLPGNGLVAYVGGLLLACDDASEAAATDLIEALRETAATGGDGRALARRAAQALARSMTGDPATCAVAGPVSGGVAVLVSGAASATVVTAEGETRLSGTDSLTWADRLITGQVQRVELSLPGAGRPHPAVGFDGGIVGGAGLIADMVDAPGPRAGSRSRTDAGALDARPLTEELPNTALHFEPDLMPQPPSGPQPQPQGQSQPQVQPAPVQMAPYPMPSPEPPRAESPSSGPQAPPEPPQYEPPHFDPPAYEPPFEPQQSGGFDQQPGGFEQGPPPGFDQGPQPGFEQGPQPGFEQGPPPGFDQGPQQGFDQGPPPGFEQGPQPGFEQGPPPGFDQGPPPGQQPPVQDPWGPPPGVPAGAMTPPDAAAPNGAASEGDQRPMVYGVDCKNDHFNDPRVPYCAVCGIALVQRTLVPYKGPRPSLGVLILDDGMALPLESDYLLGRDPERAPEVAGGTARPAKVTSPDGSVSRRHLRVALDGWDVNLVDLGSVNGTQIQPPGDPNFYDIPPNEPVTITPGTTVRVGVSRTMRFEAHRG
ncbi:FHA domain-containing protein [Nonomuraea typhae]|uniref:FHA domain-containing protein n=1 Tax=Nonomuraea typhae TaxID=2603600 RepID=UPI0012FA7EF4|nr:FHA domain-containing protein [Nonomuraea typhae]